MPSSFLLCYEYLDYVKLNLFSLLFVVRYGHSLLVKSLFLEVFGEWQVSLKDECFPSRGDCKTPKMT